MKNYKSPEFEEIKYNDTDILQGPGEENANAGDVDWPEPTNAQNPN